MDTLNYTSLIAELGVKGFVQGDEYRSKCPLHDDQNPSFSMNIETGLWTCFAKCGSGNFTQLVARYLSCNTSEAFEWVKSNGQHQSVEKLSRELATMLGQVPGQPNYVPPSTGWHARWQLLTNQIMPMWFLNRGFSWKTVNEWDIRYDPGTDAIVLPIKWKGELIGTITRNTLPQYPKYVNDPFGLKKSEIIFGEISTDVEYIILVEGALDPVWCKQNGLNCGAILGNSISAKQIQILQEYRFGEIVLALDNDEEGEYGTKVAFDKLLQAGWMHPQIKLMKFPQGHKDPNDCDPDLLHKLFDERKEYLFQ